MQKELLIVKLGGSVITDKNKAFTAKENVIFSLAKEIKVSLRQFDGDLIIVHGSGSFGHTIASKYKTHQGILNKESFMGFSFVADAAMSINRIVVKKFLEAGLKVVSFSPLSMIVSKGEKKVSFYLDPIRKAMDLGFIPVLYGDVVLDQGKRGFGIYSGEKIISVLIDSLRRSYVKVRIIYCTDTDGVYDDKGKTIKKIDRKELSRLRSVIYKTGSKDVTGGMLHKVTESLKMAENYGASIYIVNGLKRGELKKSISGMELGTKISG